MYLDFYQLKEKPFPISSGLPYFYPGSSHQAALGVLTRGVSERRGLMAVLGEFGLGKTTLIRAFSAEAGRDSVKIIPVLNSRLSLEELLLLLCRELGQSGEKEERTGLANRFIKGLRGAQQAGTGVVLLIDEAHNIPEETLEGLRLVFDTAAPLEKIFQIVFFGEPVFWELLGHHDLRPLKQRIGTVVTLSPLTPAEGREYIELRIARAGGRVEAVFTRGALDRVIRGAGGNPARINILCSNALAAGYEKAQRPLAAGTVQEVIRGPRGAGRVNYLPWALSAAGVLLILVVWLALNPSPVFSPQRPPQPAVTRQEPPAPAAPAQVSEARPLPAAPAVSPPETKEAATEPPPPLPRAEEKPPAVKKPPAASGTGSKHQGDHPPALKKPPVRATRVVKKGDNIYRLTWEVYGFSSPELLEHVRKYNPGLKDFRRLPLGEKVVFPEWPEGKPR